MAEKLDEILQGKMSDAGEDLPGLFTGGDGHAAILRQSVPRVRTGRAARRRLRQAASRPQEAGVRSRSARIGQFPLDFPPGLPIFREGGSGRLGEPGAAPFGAGGAAAAAGPV